MVVGRASEAGEMLTDLCILAGTRGQQKCYLALPETQRVEVWARDNGFADQNGGMLIYEQLI